jgi:hypothetical protein
VLSVPRRVEQLDEPLATMDSALAAEATKYANVTVLEL